MKVSCQACGAKYTIADDKVRGRKVKIRCKSCGAPIVVDAQSEVPPPPEAAPAADAAAPAAGGARTEAWSVNLSDTDQRNMTTDEIIAGWRSGVVTSDAFVWKEGMGDWVAILECDELRSVLPAAEAAPDPSLTPFGPTIVTAQAAPAASKGLPAARVSGGRARGGVDLFDAVDGGGEDDVATSAPAFPGLAGTQPYDDGKLTGARNENSVLFSLDALKGGLTIEPAKKTPSPASRAVATDPLVASQASMLGGGASPLFSLSADQALLTAPAPPDPPPRAVDAGDGRLGRAPNKLVVYGGAGAAAVALLGLGLLLGRSGKEETPKDSGTEQAASSASAAPEKKEEKKEEAKTEEAKPEASAAAAPTASASAKKIATGPSGPSGPKKETAPAGTETTTPKEPKKEEAPAVGTAPFSVSAAQVALTQAAGNASGCKKPDGPTGSGKVKVTFATSGRVTSANVDGPPFAGTPVGGCVAGQFRRAKVPPFVGNPVTVSKSFSIK